MGEELHEMCEYGRGIATASYTILLLIRRYIHRFDGIARMGCCVKSHPPQNFFCPSLEFSTSHHSNYHLSHFLIIILLGSCTGVCSEVGMTNGCHLVSLAKLRS